MCFFILKNLSKPIEYRLLKKRPPILRQSCNVKKKKSGGGDDKFGILSELIVYSLVSILTLLHAQFSLSF